MYEIVSELLERLDPNSRELFEERAGLCEFEALLPREEAESYALLDVLGRYPFALTGVTLLQIDGETEARWILTNDPDAERLRLHAGGVAARVVDLADVLTQQFAGAAMLVPVPERAP